MKKQDLLPILRVYGQIGVSALAAAPPVDSGISAASWTCSVVKRGTAYWIIWKNRRDADGRPVVILLQYGHATGTGGYVQGRDFINPAIKPVFDKIAEEVWKVVISA